MITREEVIQKLDIKNYYESKLKYDKWKINKGIALCPFHNDKNPSLSIDSVTGQFECFGCYMSGSIFDFHMEVYNHDSKSIGPSIDFEWSILFKLNGPEPYRTPQKTLEILQEIRWKSIAKTG